MLTLITCSAISTMELAGAMSSAGIVQSRAVNPMVTANEVQATIAGRLDDDCCGCKDPTFAIQYEPDKIKLTQDEFDRAVAEFNNAVKKPIWWYPLWPLCVLFHAFTCHICDPYQKGGCVDFVLEKMAEKMSSQFAHKGVVFSIRVRLEPSLWGAIPCIGDLYAEKDGYFLVIQQQSGQPC